MQTLTMTGLIALYGRIILYTQTSISKILVLQTMVQFGIAVTMRNPIVTAKLPTSKL